MKVRDLTRLVESDGWKHVRTTGSHRHFKHLSKPNVLTIPGHLAEVDFEGRRIGGEEMSRRYAVIFEQAENNWAAYVPDLPGCITTGETLEETERNILEAMQGHLRTLGEFGEPIPEPTSLAKEIEVSPAA